MGGVANSCVDGRSASCIPASQVRHKVTNPHAAPGWAPSCTPHVSYQPLSCAFLRVPYFTPPAGFMPTASSCYASSVPGDKDLASRLAGTGHVVLTLGSLGAALIRTCDPPAPRGAPGTTPGSVLPPLELRACACAPGTRRGACTANSSSSSSSHRVGAGCGCAGQTRHGVAVQGLGGGSAAVGSTLAPVPCAGSTGNALARQCHVAGFVRQHPIHCCQPAEVACECGISKGSAAGRVGGDVRGWLGEAWGIGPAGCHASQGLVMRQCSGGEGGGGHRVVAGGRVAECAGVLANDNSSSSGGSRTGSSSFWVEVLHLRALPAEVVSVNGAGGLGAHYRGRVALRARPAAHILLDDHWQASKWWFIQFAEMPMFETRCPTLGPCAPMPTSHLSRRHAGCGHGGLPAGAAGPRHRAGVRHGERSNMQLAPCTAMNCGL